MQSVVHEIAEILNEGKRVNTFNDKFGTKYVFQVKTQDGTLAEVNRQTDTPPAVGDRYQTLRPPKEGTSYPPTLRDKEGAQNGAGRGRSPEEIKAIQRQHSQEMALRWMSIQSQRGKVPEEFSYDELKPIIDWFVKDIAS